MKGFPGAGALPNPAVQEEFHSASAPLTQAIHPLKVRHIFTISCMFKYSLTVNRFYRLFLCGQIITVLGIFSAGKEGHVQM